MSGFTSTDLATLRAALASGTRMVRFEDGRSVEYATTDELMRALAFVEAQISVSAGTAPRRHYNPVYSKGV